MLSCDVLAAMQHEGGSMAIVPVELELGPKRRVFAQAQGWVGWCRAGRDAETALAVLLAAGKRYAPVATCGGVHFIPPQSTAGFVIVERVAGTAVTDVGAPRRLFASDRRAVDGQEIDRQAWLRQASWVTFDGGFRRIAH